MALIRTECALCGNGEYRLLQPGSLDERDIEPAGSYSSSRTHAGYFPIVECSTCRLVRSAWRDDDHSLSATYAGLEDVSYDEEYENRLRTASAYLDWVKRFCFQPQSLLDIGCSTGIFLTQASRAGWKVSGLEPSMWAARVAADRLPGVSISVGSIENAGFSDQTFEAITLWDVLEHLPAPAEALSRMHGWLKPAGWLFLNTPDIGSAAARLLGKHWVLFLREHIWYFSEGTLTEMLAKTGFKPVATRSNTVRFSLGTVIERLNQARDPRRSNRKGSFAVIQRLYKIPLRFPIGEMTIAAQKI